MFTLLAMSAGEITGIIIACVVVLALIAVIFGVLPVRIWFRALVSGVKVPMARLIGMKWRGVKVATIVDAYISASKAGLNVTIDELETHVLAKGDAIKVVNALISAHSANIKLEPETARAIDLAGRDVLNAVKVSVNPKVIETPPISAIAKDGIELRVKARVTVRANITRLIGGAGEDTIIARIGEGIVTTVGSAESHKDVLENPDQISKTVLNKGLDNGTAFDLVHRHRRHRRRAQHRCAIADGSGGGGQAHRRGKGGRAPCDGGRARAGDEGEVAGDESFGHRGGGGSAQGDGKGAARRQSRRDGLLQYAKRAGGHRNAQLVDR